MIWFLAGMIAALPIVLTEVTVRYRRYSRAGLIDRRHRFVSYVQASAMDKDLNRAWRKAIREKAQR